MLGLGYEHKRGATSRSSTAPGERQKQYECSGCPGQPQPEHGSGEQRRAWGSHPSLRQGTRLVGGILLINRTVLGQRNLRRSRQTLTGRKGSEVAIDRTATPQISCG